MTSFVEVIRFRVLSSKLDNNEFNAFILEFIRKCGRNVLMTSLFNPFITTNTNINHQALHTCIGIIKQIMESRKSKAELPYPLSHTQTTIHSLSPELIGELSSYLCQRGNCAFGAVNRTIYIACNTPNTLQQLDLTASDNYSMIRLQKYPHLRSLSVQLNQFHQLQLPTDGGTVCNHLQRLTICGNKQRDIDIDPFMQQTAINLNNIAQLECQSFGTSGGVFSCTKFIRLLSKFTQLKTFIGGEMMLDSARSYSPQRDSNLQNLTDLTWDGGGNRVFFFAILTAHGAQLTTLKFMNHPSVRFKQELVNVLTNVSFANLQRIMIRNPTCTIIKHLLQTGTNIQEIEFALTDREDLNTQTLMEQILTQQKSLAHLHVTSKSYGVHNAVCNGIEKGLFAMSLCKEALRIDLTFGGSQDIKDILFTISRIAKQLQSFDIQSFVLTYTFKGAHELHSDQHIIDFMRKNRANFKTYLEWNCVIVKK
eukprot:605061_1